MTWPGPWGALLDGRRDGRLTARQDGEEQPREQDPEQSDGAVASRHVHPRLGTEDDPRNVESCPLYHPGTATAYAEPGRTPAGAMAYPDFLSSVRTSLATALSVSKTPTPVGATASYSGTLRGLSSAAQLLDRGDVGQVALVVLDHVGDLVEVVALLRQVDAQVLDRLEVGLHALDLRVGHEDHAVDALQDQLAGGVVEDLAGHRVEVEAGLEAADLAERERQEVEEERALGLGGEGDHLPLRLRVGLGVDVLEVGRLPAQAGAVVDDLAVDLARAVVDEAHVYSLKRLSMSSSVISAKGLAAPGAACFFARTSKILASSSPAFFTRRRTSPSELWRRR